MISSFTLLLHRITQHWLVWRVVLVLLLMAVCYLAVTPRPPQELDLGWDKMNHMVAFMSLTIAGCLGFQASRRFALGVSLSMMLLGVLIEVVQLYVPGRSAEWGDLVGDAIGIACGLAVALLMLRWSRVIAP